MYIYLTMYCHEYRSHKNIQLFYKHRKNLTGNNSKVRVYIKSRLFSISFISFTLHNYTTLDSKLYSLEFGYYFNEYICL